MIDDTTVPLEFTIREIMAGDPAFTSPQTPVSEAAALMNRRKIGAVVVCDRPKIVGILTERDLLRAIASGQQLETLPVANLMTRAPFVIDADASWTAAANLMVE
jgi:CBS domain-containing protein